MSLVATEADTVRTKRKQFRKQRLRRLKKLDFFILDNSIRESTVGQIRSHTLENKLAIFDQVKKCGMKDILVASFAHMTRVDDDFCQHLKDSGEDFTNLWSFSEVTEGVKDGRYDTERVPVSCTKNKKYGLRHCVFEMDLSNPSIEWGTKWTEKDQGDMLAKWFRWVRTNIYAEAKILVNFRDFSLTMSKNPERCLKVIEYLAKMPKAERIFGIVYEDLGDSLPEELGMWTASARKIMDAFNWVDARMLVHIHEQWDLQTAATLACLEHGADGVWASICEEGAAVGHASSSVTTMNLVRLGNKKVLKRYNVEEMREAARKITKITTGRDPSPRQVLYGERALDTVFGFPLGFVREFDMGKFFGVTPPNRINTLASATMIKDRLINVFGAYSGFTQEIGQKMKEKMLEDLRSGRKEEYMSKSGLAMLFDRSGGKITAEMGDVITQNRLHNQRHTELIDDVKTLWDTWDLMDKVVGDDRLQFDSFYHGFMAPYFGCYRCTLSKQALKAIDMDSDGYVDWNEFRVYLRWALRQYPDIEDADQLLEVAFQKGLIPAARDINITDRVVQGPTEDDSSSDEDEEE